MAAKTGSSKVIAHGISGTWGTADAISTGDKCIVDNFTHNKNPEELTETGIGSGADMAADAQQGATTPQFGITGTMYYNDSKWQAVANFFQGQSVTGNANGYTHSFIHGGFDNAKYLTTVAQYAANSVMEGATGLVSRINTKFSGPPNYAKIAYDVLANDIKYTGTTNSYATVDAATLSNTKKIFAKNADTVVINGTTYPTTDVEVTLTKDLVSAREMKGSTGNGVPYPNGSPPFQGTVTITFKSLDDHTFFSGALADSVFIIKTTHTGDTISAYASYTFEWRFPACKLIQQPQSDIVSGGYDPLTLTFKTITATSIPSGMYSYFPHCILINDKSTTYLA